MKCPWEGGKAPRHWAADILDGQASLDDVPERYRAMVSRHLEISVAHIEHWTGYVLAGINRDDRRGRLQQCPRGLRTAVEAAAREEWRRQQQTTNKRG